MRFRFTILSLSIAAVFSSCSKEVFLYSSNTGSYHQSNTKTSIIESDEKIEEPILTASITSEPTIINNSPITVEKVSTANKIKALYNSDNKDLKEFRREYKGIKKEFRENNFGKLTLKNKINKTSEAKEGGSAGFSIASLAVAFVGIFVAALLMGILAIIFGAIGIAKGKLKGLAIAGLVLGILEVIIGLAALA